MTATRSLARVVLLGVLAACAESRQPPAQDDSPQHFSPIEETPPSESPPALTPIDADRSGAVALAERDGQLVALIADADERALHAVDVATQKQLAVTPLSDEPTHVLALSSGEIAVSFRFANRVAIFDLGEDWTLSQSRDTEVATEPIAMVERPTHGEIVVVSGFGAQLTALDRASMRVRTELPLPREPRAVVLSDNGEEAFVSHMVGGAISNVSLRSQVARQINLDVGSVFTGTFEISSVPRSTNQGFALVKARNNEASWLFAPSVSVDPGDLSEPVSAGYGAASPSAPNPVSPVVMAIDAASGRVLTGGLTTEHDNTHVDCLLPRAAATANGKLWVACLGINSVVELDARSAYPSMLEHRRFPVPDGPTSLSVHAAGHRLVVWSQFARELAIIDLESGRVETQTLAQRDETLMSAQLRRGRTLFFSTQDARISSDHRACASCHPDGRDDGLLWTTPDGKRQTKLLAGHLGASAPFGWFGEHATLREHLRGTFKNLGGSGFDIGTPQANTDVEALMAYLRALPGPHLPPAEPSRIARGRALYEDEARGCAGCHPGGSTNGLAYNLGSGGRGERLRSFDTPTLRFIASSAPYFHDGRYPTLRALLIAEDVEMGHTRDLSHSDLDALETYLRTL